MQRCRAGNSHEIWGGRKGYGLIMEQDRNCSTGEHLRKPAMGRTHTRQEPACRESGTETFFQVREKN